MSAATVPFVMLDDCDMLPLLYTISGTRSFRQLFHQCYQVHIWRRTSTMIACKTLPQSALTTYWTRPPQGTAPSTSYPVFPWLRLLPPLPPIPPSTHLLVRLAPLGTHCWVFCSSTRRVRSHCLPRNLFRSPGLVFITITYSQKDQQSNVCCWKSCVVWRCRCSL